MEQAFNSLDTQREACAACGGGEILASRGKIQARLFVSIMATVSYGF